MKSILSAMLLLLMPALHAADNVMNITVKPGDTQFRVKLAGNPTTGYQWTLSEYDNTLMKLVSHQFVPANNHLMGSGGTSIFTLSVVQTSPRPKNTELTFRYSRSWEPKGGSLKIVRVHFK